MMKYLILIFAFAWTSNSIACEMAMPEVKQETFPELLERAQFIALAKAYPEGKRYRYDYEEAEPRTVQLEIIKNIKGQELPKIITVNSSYAMCGHDFLLSDDNPKLIFLSSYSDSNKFYYGTGSYMTGPSYLELEPLENNDYNFHFNGKKMNLSNLEQQFKNN